MRPRCPSWPPPPLLLLLLLLLSSPLPRRSEAAPSAAPPPRARFAVCLNGQVLRLELASKVHNLLVPNLRAGHAVHVFAHLVPASSGVARTAKSALLVDTFAACTAQQLGDALENSTRAALRAAGEDDYVDGNFAVFPSFVSKLYSYEIVGDKGTPPIGQDFGGHDRFQGNFRMLSQMRTCMQLVSANEVRTRTHYDFVVRLRDDAFVYAPWRFKPRAYAGAFVALPVAGWGGGLNDHAFVADRSLADAFFSHVLEDYYLDNNVSGRNAPYVIRNTERMLRSVAQRYSAPVALLNLCDLPAITIKYADDPRVWRTDETYVEIYEREMSGPKEQFYRTLCPDHLPALRRQSYPRMPPDTGVACGPAGGG